MSSTEEGGDERCPSASSSLRQMPFRRSSTAFSRSCGLPKNKLCHCADLQRTSLDKTHQRIVCSLENGSNLFATADSDSTLAQDPRHVLATVARCMNLLHFKRCRQFPTTNPHKCWQLLPESSHKVRTQTAPTAPRPSTSVQTTPNLEPKKTTTRLRSPPTARPGDQLPAARPQHPSESPPNPPPTRRDLLRTQSSKKLGASLRSQFSNLLCKKSTVAHPCTPSGQFRQDSLRMH